MSVITKEIGGTIKDGHGDGLIYGLIIGGIIANATPVPTDALMFYRERKDKEALERHEITPKQYWGRQALYYYTFASLYWGGVLLVISSVGGGYNNKLKWLSAIVAGGLVIGVLSKNIQQDNILYGVNENNKQPANPQQNPNNPTTATT